MTNYDICLSFTGSINEQNARNIASAFTVALSHGHTEILFVMNSGGGVISDGMYLHNIIRAYPANVTTHCVSEAASIAVQLFLSGSRRLCTQDSSFVLHPTLIPTPGSSVSATDMQSMLSMAQERDGQILSAIREYTTIPDNILNASLLNEIVITSGQPLTWGLVHEIKELSLPTGLKLLQI